MLAGATLALRTLVARAAGRGVGPLSVRPAVAPLAFVAETVGSNQNPAPVHFAGAHAALVDPRATAVGQLALARGLAVHAPALPGERLEHRYLGLAQQRSANEIRAAFAQGSYPHLVLLLDLASHPRADTLGHRTQDAVPHMRGVPLPVVWRPLGHKRSSVTLRYAQVGDRDIEQAAERVGQVIAAIMGGANGKGGP